MQLFAYVSRQFETSKWEWALYALIFVIFICNGLYVSYPDEYVNLLGGRTIMQGGLPYRDFFDHHLPLAWSISAPILKLTFGHFVLFRIAWAAIAFSLLFILSRYIKKELPELYKYFMIFFFTYPLLAVYFWLHIFIADGIASLFFVLTFWITLVETYKKKSNISMLLLASFLNFCLIFSSLTFLFLTIALYAWQFYLVLREHRNTKDILSYIVSAVFPYAYYLVHLLVTGTFQDFYIANYLYNTKHYVFIKNYTPGAYFNPFKFAGAIIHNFYNDYLPLLTTVKHLDLYLPVLTLAAWSTLFLLIFFFFENKFLFILYFFVLSFSAPRSNIQKYSETNYQMGIFLVLGLISAVFVLYRQKHIRFVEPLFNTFKTAAMVIVMVFLLFTTIFLAKNTYDKAFLRYTHAMPGISSRSFVAMFIDEIIRPGEYFWVGPYEPHHAFPVKNGLLPGKYPTLLPQFRESDYFSAEFIKQFETNPPKFLIFKHESSIFQTPADTFGRFFLNWMEGKYITLEEIPGYEQVKSPTEFNLKGDLYMKIEDQEEILQRLMDAGYVKRL